ncbi:MAG TPA: hypothetical protein VK886_09445 [Vicinamibacterales bacterium]|nr:hypothetical protein [Vicinamibacterales bacterium]
MRATIAAVTLLVVIPGSAAAQGAPQPAGPQGNAPDRISVQRVYNRFIVGPDYKLTAIDGDTGQLAGVSAGWLREELFYIGGAFYWLAGGASDWDMHYGGLVLGVQMPAGRRIAFGVKGLLGLGEATNRATITELLPGLDGFFPWQRTGRFGSRHGFVPGDTHVEVSERFLMVEPEAMMSVSVTDRIRFGVCAGYRFTGDADAYAFEDRLNGATGTLTVQFGFGGS